MYDTGVNNCLCYKFEMLILGDININEQILGMTFEDKLYIARLIKFCRLLVVVGGMIDIPQESPRFGDSRNANHFAFGP